MTTFSVPERKQPRPNRRDMEISKVITEALEKAVFTEQFPNTEIAVFVEVIDANAGSRVACLTAASCALADAGIPMKDLVSAVGVGKAYGELVLDLDKAEEDAPDAVDTPIAILPNSEEIVLLQMDGLLTRKEWDSVTKMGVKACKEIYEVQKAALKERFEIAELTKASVEKAVTGVESKEAPKESKKEKAKSDKPKKVRK
jgi:exosome complex component RRP41